MKNDVESIVVQKKPTETLGNIVYLTDGPTNATITANRKTIYRDEDFIVEDMLDPSGEVTRRLVAIKNYLRQQSQVILETGAGELAADSELWGLVKPEASKKPVRNTKMLDFAYNRALFLAIAGFGKPQKTCGAVIGLGSGILGDFIKTYMTKVDLTEVEKSQNVIDIATKYFFYDRKALQSDGIDFINGLQPASLDFIAVDVDECTIADSIMPPKSFSSHSFISKAAEALSVGGVLAIVGIPKVGGNTQELQEELTHSFGKAWDIPAMREEFHIYVSVKTEDRLGEDWMKLGSKKLKEMKSAIMKNSQDDWEENEFTEIAEGIIPFTAKVEASMSK